MKIIFETTDSPIGNELELVYAMFSDESIRQADIATRLGLVKLSDYFRAKSMIYDSVLEFFKEKEDE